MNLLENPLTLFLVAVTSIVSIIAFNNHELMDKAKFNAYMVYHKRDYGRLLSHGLVHSGWMHLLVNMYVLYLFGGNIETLFSLFSANGKFWYIFMYVTALVVASLPSLFKHKDNHYYNAVGASGAVSAVVFSLILIAPTEKFGFLLIPGLRFPAYVFGALYLAYTYYMVKRGKDNIAHEAHFAGSVYGFFFPLIFAPGLLMSFWHQIVG